MWKRNRRRSVPGNPAAACACPGVALIRALKEPNGIRRERDSGSDHRGIEHLDAGGMGGVVGGASATTTLLNPSAGEMCRRPPGWWR